MTEHEPKPIVIAEKANLVNKVMAFLDSPIFRMRMHIGILGADGKTVQVGEKTIVADNVNAEPGEKVITHEII